MNTESTPKMREPKGYIVSNKQYEVLRVICVPEGEPLVDMDQLLERITYKTSKESMHFTLRALIRNGLITKANREIRRGRSRVLFEVTELGKSVAQAGVSPTASFVEPTQGSIEAELDDLFFNSEEPSLSF